MEPTPPTRLCTKATGRHVALDRMLPQRCVSALDGCPTRPHQMCYWNSVLPLRGAWVLPCSTQVEGWSGKGSSNKVCPRACIVSVGIWVARMVDGSPLVYTLHKCGRMTE